MTKINIIFYSMYGHVYRMAEAVAEGVRQAADAEAKLFQVHELVPEEILEKSGAAAKRAEFAHVPFATPDDAADADGVIFGTPTRYGNMCAQIRNYLDQTGPLWLKGAFIGKAASVFTSTSSQHGGQETTITSFHSTLFHLGYVVVGVPYTEERLLTMSEITGGSPYGAATLSGADNSRVPSENELGIARFQGKYLTEIARKLKG